MHVVVVGAGSLGSLIGGCLAREHAVTLVGRDPHVETIATEGLQISGEIETRVRPEASTTCPSDGDLALVTVKAHDTDAAAADVVDSGLDATLDAALSLQNGLGNEAVLADALACPVLAGTCTYGARLVGPGHVECTGVGEVALGARDGGDSVVANRVGAAFVDGGLETVVAEDMPRRLWTKLAVNAGINPTTALARIRNGALADGPAGETAREAARETARVAQSAGVDLDASEAVAALETVVADTAANHSSMLQDVEAGRRTEVEAINGAVVDRVPEAGLAVPVNETLAALVAAWESTHVDRASSHADGADPNHADAGE